MALFGGIGTVDSGHDPEGDVLGGVTGDDERVVAHADEEGAESGGDFETVAGLSEERGVGGVEAIWLKEFDELVERIVLTQKKLRNAFTHSYVSVFHYFLSLFPPGYDMIDK